VIDARLISRRKSGFYGVSFDIECTVAAKEYPNNRSGVLVMNTRSHRILAAAIVAGFGTLAASSAFADTAWEKSHPRREEVNNRLASQNQRITEERREGELTRDQAQHLRSEDRAIRQEERDMARQNGGHITKSEQVVLNQQLNKVSHQIGR
jgi:hypothetical protein